MEYRKLGTTGIEVSVFALGCWPFAGGAVWGEQDEDVSIATVHAALDKGINFFDTAEGYEKGHSERVLGRGLEGRRDEAVIATKVSASHLKPSEIVKACEQSLENLRTDYIDLYQIHWPNWEVPIEVSWQALEALKSSGKVRALGVSNFGVQDMGDLLEKGHCETNQLNYGLLWRVVEHEDRDHQDGRRQSEPRSATTPARAEAVHEQPKARRGNDVQKLRQKEHGSDRRGAQTDLLSKKCRQEDEDSCH